MVEPARFSFILLLIAMANLATDITRLLLELVPSRAIQESVSMQTRPAQQETSGQAPETSQPDTTRKDVPQKKAKSLDATDARGPPRGPREPGIPRVPFSPLPRDFSINCPPWRLACRQPMHRNFDRRGFYDW
jgi:hypothetical protein